jgi:hypothetical protein
MNMIGTLDQNQSLAMFQSQPAAAGDAPLLETAIPLPDAYIDRIAHGISPCHVQWPLILWQPSDFP